MIVRPAVRFGIPVLASVLSVGAGAIAVVPTAVAAAQQKEGKEGTPAASLKLPEGEVSLGTVRIPAAVMADGKRLNAGTYRLRLTKDLAKPPDVVGQTDRLERWVEFVQGGDVKGRAVASIVPAAAIKEVAETAPPAAGHSRVERLKGGDYLRVWVNKNGDHVLVHLPLAQ